MTYTLDLETVAGIGDEGGKPALMLGDSLWIRAASGQRPVIVLKQPLRFRPADVTSAEAPALLSRIQVRLEGLYVTWDRRSSPFQDLEEGLIRQAALNALEIRDCTLDPGGEIELDGTTRGTRRPMRPSLRLAGDYGFTRSRERAAFRTPGRGQIPQLTLTRSICGVLAVDEGYRLEIEDAIIDARSGVDSTAPALAMRAESGPASWCAPLEFRRLTCFGRARVGSVTGEGGIWIGGLEAQDDQSGCLRFSYLPESGNRIPPHVGCVFGPPRLVRFVSEVFGEPGYAQLGLGCDDRVLEQGPDNDAMGAFGYLALTHKWKNLNIRYREFMPLGVRAALVPVT